MLNLNFSSLLQLADAFPDEQSCIKYLEFILWDNIPISPFDPKSKVYKCKPKKCFIKDNAGNILEEYYINTYKCHNTNKYFNVKSRTVFQGSKTPLRKWFVAFYLITSHKKGISSIQLSKHLGLTQCTTWKLMHKIRGLMAFANVPAGDNEEPWELDESVFGGKNKNKHKDKKIRYDKGRAFPDKTWVFGMFQRNGNVILQVVPDTQQVTLQTLVWNTVPLGSMIFTDEWRSYFNLKDDYRHGWVEHSKGRYAYGIIHTNSIECFWSSMKRTIIGTYHQVKRKYLQNYCYESAFRYNTRQLTEGERFNFLLNNCDNLFAAA